MARETDRAETAFARVPTPEQADRMEAGVQTARERASSAVRAQQAVAAAGVDPGCAPFACEARGSV